jgi:hypothetical protein
MRAALLCLAFLSTVTGCAAPGEAGSASPAELPIASDPATAETSIATTPATEVTVPEGQLVIQLRSRIEILGPGTTRSLSLGGEPIYAYGVSPDGSRIVAASYVAEPTHYTRADLLAIDTVSGQQTVLVRAGSTEDLGPAVWSPDNSEVAYRVSTWRLIPPSSTPVSLRLNGSALWRLQHEPLDAPRISGPWMASLGRPTACTSWWTASEQSFRFGSST